MARSSKTSGNPLLKLADHFSQFLISQNISGISSQGVAAAQQAAGQEEIRCGQHGVRGGAGHPGRVQAAVTSDLMKGK